MGITLSKKEVNTSVIDCGGSLNVKISLAAEPHIVGNPQDIVLVLDQSGSMRGAPLANLKTAAKLFIDIIDEATDEQKDGHIGNGSRMGIVAFDTEAEIKQQLITSVNTLKDTVDALSADANGSTNHSDAFQKAMQTFNPNSTNAKIMVMFTDGNTTAGGDAEPFAQQARDMGITIYCIGLIGKDGIDVTQLEKWASPPASAYVAVSPNAQDLEALFLNVAANILKPGATGIKIVEKITDCFGTIAMSAATKGTARLIDARTIEWIIPALGITQSEGAYLNFMITHNGQCTGTLNVNESITYSDNEKNVVKFDNPSVYVDCEPEVVIMPEPCPTPLNIEIGECEDALEFDAGDLALDSLGRILELDLRLKNICPHRRVALGIVLSEIDQAGNEHKRGMKTMEIPAHTKTTCTDIMVKCVKFILPESLDVTGSTESICNKRYFKARMIAHYIDTDYKCCDTLED